MNLGTAFLIAGSGLAANGRATSVVSANVANALTEGYGRREAIMAQTFPGSISGVKVDNIARQVDMAAVGEARLSGGSAAGTGLLAAFARRAEVGLGQPGEPGSLPTALARMEAAFAEAALRPDSDARLANLGTAMTEVVRTLGAATDDLQQARTEADRGIAADVDRLNSGLSTVARMDRQIIAMTARGEDTGALQDERQRLIDIMAEVVPLREVPRPDGRAALVTTGGLVLLDGHALAIGFAPTRTISAEMTLADGDLSGLTVDGQPVALNAPPGLMDGGGLAARFAIRDIGAPAAQDALDTLARDLVERLADPALDPSRPPGDPGLLTDAGLPFDPLRSVGLAGRLSVNPLVDPTAGGAFFRLRDGLGAAAPGPVGNGALLARATDILSASRITSGGGIPAGTRTVQDLAADVLSRAAGLRLAAEGRDSAAAAEAATLRGAVAANGVNTDAEMQRLLALEQAYAANARVLSVVDALFAELLEATR